MARPGAAPRFALKGKSSYLGVTNTRNGFDTLATARPAGRCAIPFTSLSEKRAGGGRQPSNPESATGRFVDHL
jgi:hypothetical protein